MLDDERSILRTCAAYPNADLPRLVLADWLDDHDQPERAEFIRVSVAAADTTTASEEQKANRRRATELLTIHRGVWDQPLRDLGVGQTPGWWDPPPPVTYSRGLPVAVVMPLGVFLARGAEIQAVAPTVTGLDLGLQGLCDTDVERLATCPHLAGFTELNVRKNRLGDASARALALSPYVGQLRALDLSMNVGLGTVGWLVLAESPYFAPEIAIMLGPPENDPQSHRRLRELLADRGIGQPPVVRGR